MADIPETYHITGDSGGLASREYNNNIFGQYDLFTTSYKNVNVLLYKKNTTGTVFWMFNITETGFWMVGYEEKEFVMMGKGHELHAPSHGWKLPIKIKDYEYRHYADSSIIVRADIGKFDDS